MSISLSEVRWSKTIRRISEGSRIATMDRTAICVVGLILLSASLFGYGGPSGIELLPAQTKFMASPKSPNARISASVKPQDILVTVVLVNRGPEPFPLLRWNLPSDGKLTDAIFEVRRNGELERYSGEQVKRRVTAADYIFLRAGRKYTTTISLRQAYEVNASGTYEIRYKVFNQLPAGRLCVLSSPEITVQRLAGTPKDRR